MTIRKVEAWVFRAPIAKPVKTSFGSLTNRPAVFIRVSAGDGAWGWGEVFCNFPQVGAEHRARLLDNMFAPLLAGAPSDDPPALRRKLEAQTRLVAIQCGEPGPFAQVISAIDQALWDLAARRAGVPLWKLLAGTDANAASPRVRVYASGLGPDRVADMALSKRLQGHTAFKFKVGFGTQRDQANFSAIREAVGDDAAVMVDANQAWTLQDAAQRIAELAPFKPLWVEEPLAADESTTAWQLLAGECGIPLAAGENLRGMHEFETALHAGYLGFVQPDVAKWGGISACRDVALLAARQGAVFCPHWLGGGIGLAASLHLRAALGPQGYAEVDANPNPLREEVFEPAPVNGWVTLGNEPGLGVEPDLLRLAPYLTAHA
ncbi:MAG: mandelate racemase/muconate lactonizing enzyme family protein [Bdellovibrionales bacterium]|nr:mandelate racemase/muconate lactonizing enzyme family protein [Ramlibacter sp.]